MIMCILSNRLEKRSGKKFPGRFLEMKKYKTEKISICGKKSYFYINVRPLVHNNFEQPTDGGWTQRRTNNMRATALSEYERFGLAMLQLEERWLGK